MAKPFRNDGKPRINDGLKVLLDNLDKIKELASLNLSIISSGLLSFCTP